MELTEYRYRDSRDSPFVMNHSCLLPPTEKVLAERASEISLYLSTNKMLLGIDLADIDVIIFLRPYNQPAALVQGGGRGGRRMENGKRRQVQVYQFFNSQDFTSQDKMMSPDMKRICLSQECTRKLLKEYFVGNNEDQELQEEEVGGHCCHNCDRLK
jgi:late competence protein required for DNA uptake (superfamily II DNA/RNA helicase)